MNIYQQNDTRSQKMALDMSPYWNGIGTNNWIMAPRPNENWYFGCAEKPGESFDFRNPGELLFFHRWVRAAVWFATEKSTWEEGNRPVIYTVNLDIKWPCRAREVYKTAEMLKVTPADIENLPYIRSDFPQVDPIDALFIPRVMNTLIQYDFDGFVGWDVIERDSVHVAVPFQPALQVRIEDRHQWPNATALWDASQKWSTRGLQ